MVKISIIVPMYNSSSTISQCINSVMRSISYEKRVDVEVLLVDDGSIDETIEVCEKAIDDSFDINFVNVLFPVPAGPSIPTINDIFVTPFTQ